MTAPHPFWSRVPEWLLDWALRRLYLPLTLEATRRLVERHAGESAARALVADSALLRAEPPVEVPAGYWTPERVAAFNAWPLARALEASPDPCAPLAPPNPALPTQLYGTPPPRSVLGRDPLATTKEG